MRIGGNKDEFTLITFSCWLSLLIYLASPLSLSIQCVCLACVASSVLCAVIQTELTWGSFPRTFEIMTFLYCIKWTCTRELFPEVLAERWHQVCGQVTSRLVNTGLWKLQDLSNASWLERSVKGGGWWWRWKVGRMDGDTIMTTDRAHARSEGDGSEGWVVVVGERVGCQRGLRLVVRTSWQSRDVGSLWDLSPPSPSLLAPRFSLSVVGVSRLLSVCLMLWTVGSFEHSAVNLPSTQTLDL